MIGLRGIPGVMGGVESHCEELLPRLAERLPHVRLIAIGRKPYLGNVETKSFRGVDVVSLPSPRRQSFETLVSSFLGIIYARGVGASAVHIHALASGIFAPLAKLLGMKVMLTVHGADYQRAKWGPAARTMLRLGERLGVRCADAVVCVAPTLTKTLQQRYPERADRIRFVPNGAPALAPVTDAAAILDRFGLETGNFVLAVGRVEPGKGFDHLIDAFVRSGRSGKLVIVGGAHHEQDYASALQSRAGGSVVFAGVQPRDVLAHLYATAALFVLPSLHEGLPICALEAGSVGCPVLLSDIRGNRDLALPDGHYFRSGDVESLASALRAPDDHYSVMPEMFKAFDWHRIAGSTATIYDEVIGGAAKVRHCAA